MGVGLGSILAAPDPFSVAIDPTGTFLHATAYTAPWYHDGTTTYGFDTPGLPTIVDLASSGIAPGDWLEILISGEVSYYVGQAPQPPFSVLGLFSGSASLLGQAEIQRVPGAISTGINPRVTMNTLFGDEPTDIPEDFLISPQSGFQIRVPAGANYLFLAVEDSHWGDNSGTLIGTLRSSGPNTTMANCSADARILSLNPNEADGTWNMLGVYNDGGANLQHSLFFFDLSPIGPGQLIMSATLRVYADSTIYFAGNPSGRSMEVYRLTQPWAETEVTWRVRDVGIPWSTPGGDYVGTTGVRGVSPYAANDTVVPDSYASPLLLTWNITQLVQEWYTGTHANDGLLLLSYPGNGLHFRSRENSSPIPMLEIQVAHDTMPPQIACLANLTVPCSVDLLVPVTFAVTATDDYDPAPAVVASPPSDSLFPVGTTTVNCTATDAAGNSSSCTFNVVRAPLAFSGFLAPIGGADATGSSYASSVRTFKTGSTVPVKFSAGCCGVPVLTGIHRLQVAQYTSATTVGKVIDTVAQDAATTGNQFRLADGQWMFNLDTKSTGMGAGIWLLRATLSDGSQHTAWIQLK